MWEFHYLSRKSIYKQILFMSGVLINVCIILFFSLQQHWGELFLQWDKKTFCAPGRYLSCVHWGWIPKNLTKLKNALKSIWLPKSWFTYFFSLVYECVLCCWCCYFKQSITWRKKKNRISLFICTTRPREL